MASSPQNALVETAYRILARTSDLSAQLSQNYIAAPTDLALGATSPLWTTHDEEISNLRSSILALTQHLDRLLEGPHGFLHEYVSTNWEYGALYTLLEFNVLEKIPLDGSPVRAENLAEQVDLPPEKLLRICRLVATAGILVEPEEGSFTHTAISETLVRDEGYKSFIRFQLFETRVASAHLADSLREPNPFWTGKPAFDYAWGMPMYTWHAKNPEKGARFAKAMESVSKNLDPGNSMIIAYLTTLLTTPSSPSPSTPHLIEINGKTGAFSTHLAQLFPTLHFTIQDPSPTLLAKGKSTLPPSLTARITFQEHDLFAPRTLSPSDLEPHSPNNPLIFLLRGVLWNLPDADAIKLLQSFVPLLRDAKGGAVKLLISDLVSPDWGTYEPGVERAFRRRDVTLMTMHNVMQRTRGEWGVLIAEGVKGGDFEVTYTEKSSSHSCRGLWVVSVSEQKVNGALMGNGTS